VALKAFASWGREQALSPATWKKRLKINNTTEVRGEGEGLHNVACLQKIGIDSVLISSRTCLRRETGRKKGKTILISRRGSSTIEREERGHKRTLR